MFITERGLEKYDFVIRCYRMATENTPNSRKAWQAWAMANYDLYMRLKAETTLVSQKEFVIKQAISAAGGDPTQVEAVPSPGNGPSTSSGSSNGNDAAPTSEVVSLTQSLRALIQRRSILQTSIERLAAPSVRGYINSISISPEANLQVSSF